MRYYPKTPMSDKKMETKAILEAVEAQAEWIAGTLRGLVEVEPSRLILILVLCCLGPAGAEHLRPTIRAARPARC